MNSREAVEKLPQITQNGPKWPKIAQNSPKWPPYCSKLPKIIKHDPKLPKVDFMGHLGPFWDIVCDFRQFEAILANGGNWG